MKTKKLLSLLLAMTMIFSMMSFPANAAEGHCDDEANCLVCNVADLINALPAAEDITVDNAAAVTDQIHAIDRIKFDLTDDEYDELLTLVEESSDTSGQGLGVPARYMEAVNAIRNISGFDLEISKLFLSSKDASVDVADAEVVIKITNVDTEASQTLTLATMPAELGTLSADDAFYSVNENGDGWTYRYTLPVGTYYVEEVSDSGATVDGTEFVTGAVSYNGEFTDGITVTLAEGGTHVGVGNYNSTAYNIDAVDAEGNKVSGVGMSIVYNGTESEVEAFSKEWTTDGTAAEYSLPDVYEYTLTVTSVPDGYIMPDTAEVTFTSGTTEFTTPFSYDAVNETLNVTIEKNTVPTITHTIKSVNAANAETSVDAEYSITHICCDDSYVEGIVEENTTVNLMDGHQYYISFTLNDTAKYDAPVPSSLDFTVGTEDFSSDSHDSITYDAANDTITIAYAPFAGMPEGNTTITVNFKDREGNPMKVRTDVEYVYYDYYDEYAGRYIYRMTELDDSITLTGLGDGEYEIQAIWEIEEGKKGYNINNGYCTFFIEDGKLVEDTVYGSNGDVSNIDVENGTFDITVASHEVGGLVQVPGFIDDLAWEIKDSNNNVVLSSETTDSGFLALGTYTFYVVEDEQFADYVKYPDTGISFEVKETAVDWDNEYCDIETGEVEWYPVLAESDYDVSIWDNGSARYIDWNLESTETVDVKMKVSTTDGSKFADGVNVMVTYEDDEDGTVTVLDEYLSTGASVYEKTITAATKRAVWNEPDPENGDTEGYYTFVANEYTVEGTDQNGDPIYFVKNSDGVWEATIAGVNTATYSINTDPYENGTIDLNKYTAAVGEQIKITATPDEGCELTSLSVVTYNDAGEIEDTLYTYPSLARAVASEHSFTMPEKDVTILATFTNTGIYTVTIAEDIYNGNIVADKNSASEGETVTLTITSDEGYALSVLDISDMDDNKYEYVEVDASTYTFTMPARDVYVGAAFDETSGEGEDPVPDPGFETPFTVKAEVVDTTDVDEADEDIDVYANDTVTVNVTVNGSAFTNADWTLLYDSSKFEYVSETLHDNAQKVVTGENVLGGVIRGAATKTDGDEYEDGTVVATYVFTALPQKNDEVTGMFKITDAHANTYAMAGDMNNWPANKEDTEATILLVDDSVADTVPSGSIEPIAKEYNALEQSGNEYVLDAGFEEATVTYAANTDGSAVVDDDGDGDLTDEIAALAFKTGLPTWKNVGEYTYYVKISGDGLATIYDSTTLTITPATLTPSATFAVDPAVDKVTIIPELQGVLDGSHNGKVTVTYTDKDGNEKTEELNASDFIYDGESTSVYNGVIEVEAQESGTFTVTLDYTEGEKDNYIGEENTAEIDVDKLTADDETIKALEDAIESVFPYDSEEHTVVIGELPEGWEYETPVDAYDETKANPSVTNVGDEKLVKVVFTDTTGVYNDVVVYVVLKVTPAKVRITIADHEKAVGKDDPIPFNYTLEVIEVAEDGTETVVKTDDLYGDDLTALDLELVRTPGETAGTYPITASYVPNANYEIEVIDGKLTIGAPSTEGDDADVKIEIVDLSNEADGTPDYIADKRLVLVYTKLDKVYYGYGDATNYEKMFDVTAAGYKYVDNIYADNKLTTVQDDTEYAHVYGIVVDKIADFKATEDHEALYRNKVVFLGSDAEYAPENIVYDADINLTKELDVNDYSMNNGIYNVAYDRVSYIKSILKADYDHDKVVDTTDSRAVKDVVDTAKVVTE